MEKTMLYTEVPETIPRLYTFQQDGSIMEYPMAAHMVVGRQVPGGAQVHVPLSSPLVSRNHGEMACVHGSYYYRDLGSTNGSWLSGEFLRDEATVRKLKDGDVIRICQSDNPGTAALLFSSTLPDTVQWKILSLDHATEIRIGRKTTGGLSLPDARVSADHAVFFRAKDGWAIADLGSTNGVYISGHRLVKSAYLRPLDVVRIVSAYFVFLGDRLIYCNPPAPEQFAPSKAKVPDMVPPPQPALSAAPPVANPRPPRRGQRSTGDSHRRTQRFPAFQAQNPAEGHQSHRQQRRNGADSGRLRRR